MIALLIIGIVLLVLWFVGLLTGERYAGSWLAMFIMGLVFVGLWIVLYGHSAHWGW